MVKASAVCTEVWRSGMLLLATGSRWTLRMAAEMVIGTLTKAHHCALVAVLAGLPLCLSASAIAALMLQERQRDQAGSVVPLFSGAVWALPCAACPNVLGVQGLICLLLLCAVYVSGQVSLHVTRQSWIACWLLVQCACLMEFCGSCVCGFDYFCWQLPRMDAWRLMRCLGNVSQV